MQSIVVFMCSSLITINELIKADVRSLVVWAIFAVVLPLFWAYLVY